MPLGVTTLAQFNGVDGLGDDSSTAQKAVGWAALIAVGVSLFMAGSAARSLVKNGRFKAKPLAWHEATVTYVPVGQKAKTRTTIRLMARSPAVARSQARQMVRDRHPGAVIKGVMVTGRPVDEDPGSLFVYKMYVSYLPLAGAHTRVHREWLVSAATLDDAKKKAVRLTREAHPGAVSIDVLGKKTSMVANVRRNDFRVGHRVRFNDSWERNVHLSGGQESESDIPGGVHGKVIAISGDIITVATSMGTTDAHYSYLDHVKKTSMVANGRKEQRFHVAASYIPAGRSSGVERREWTIVSTSFAGASHKARSLVQAISPDAHSINLQVKVLP